MPEITRLQLQQRRKNRVSVYLDHEYAFSVDLDVAARLRKGQTLTENEIAALRTDDAYRKALNRATRYLSYRPRSEREVRRYLEDKEVPEPTAERVLDRLAELGLVDDHAFAAWWVDNRSAHRPRGRRALRHELSQKGVPRPIIDRAIETIDEAPLASEVAHGRAARYADLEWPLFRRRLGGYLQRRGFSYDVTRRAVREAWEAVSDSA